MSRSVIKKNKVVNIAEDGEITVLDELFNYSDGFKGATGSKFYPVSKSDYDEQTETEYVIEHMIDNGLELPKSHQRTGFEGLVKDMKNSGEIESFMFDTSYRELWDYLREAAGLNEETAYIFNCVGGGRCFDKDYQGNVNPELSKQIREYEKKAS